MWQDGLDLICRNSRLIGVFTIGGFEEYVSVPERMSPKFENLDWDTAANYLIVTSCFRGSITESK